MRTIQAVRSLLSFLSIMTLLGHVSPARAAGSWQVRTFPEGSALRVEESVARGSLFLFGRFAGGTVWETRNAGISGSLHGPFPPFPADSIAAAAPGGELLIAQRSVWGKLDSAGWSPIAVPDSAGTPTAAMGDSPDRFWFGNGRGEIFSVTRSQEGRLDYERTLDLGDGKVVSLASRGPSRLIALLDDGRFYAQDTVWVESPTRFSAVDFSDARTCFGIEMSTGLIWRSPDAGLTWEWWSDALADSALARHLPNARRFRAGTGGIFLIACGDALLVSSDAGERWRIAATGEGLFEDAAYVEEFATIVTAGDRIQASGDGGYSFEQLMGSDFGDVSPGSRSTFWAVDRGLLLSLDEGKRWFRQPLPEPADRLTHILPRGDYDIWLHFDSPSGSRTLYSADRGNRYEEVDEADMLHGMRGWAALGEGPAWAWSDRSVLRSRDAGRRWTPVREGEAGIAAFGARDSLACAFIEGNRFVSTTDGGGTWLESPAPAGGARAIVPAPGGSWLAAGSGISRWEPATGWIRVFEVDSSDTLRSIALVAGGSGWAVGTSGMIIGTRDSGMSWERYRVNLELSAVDTLLAHVRLIDSDRGVTGAGNRLVRLLPDASGPVFRIGVSANPYLRDYLDIHMTAHERLQNDSISVSVDDVHLTAEMFDPSGFLFRSRYVIPGGEQNRILRVSGRDWLGNSRLDSRPLTFARLSPQGEQVVPWGDGRVSLRGPAGDRVVLLAIDSEAPPLPEGWFAVGRPFQVSTPGVIRVEPGRGAGAIGYLEDGVWRESSGAHTVRGGAILALIQSPGEIATDPDPLPLRVFPAPGPGPFQIEWAREPEGALRWEVYDLLGRRICVGSPPAGTRSWKWNGEDSERRRLPAGVYWLRVVDRGERAVARILLTR